LLEILFKPSYLFSNQANKEAKEAAEMKSQLGLGDGLDALKNAIATRGASRMDSLLAQMEDKYGNEEKKKAGANKKLNSTSSSGATKRKRAT